MTGDFNARIGQELDYVHHDPANYVPLFIDYNADYPLSRRSEDMVVNGYGKELLNLCISSHLRIVNGRFGTYKYKGSFTCFTQRGCSTVDYTLISSDFFNVVEDFYVGELSEHSDHCPLSLILRLPISKSRDMKQTIYNISINIFKCEKDIIKAFQSNENINEFASNLQKLPLNDSIQQFTELLKLAVFTSRR